VTAHRHAQSMLEYAKDAAESQIPWVWWEQCQLSLSGSLSKFEPCPGHPLWELGCEYRRKPKTININGYEVPEPMRIAPSIGTIYHVPNFVHGSFWVAWSACDTDVNFLQKGFCHFTKEAANLHSVALLSFTRINDK
jgi:hypothetical protein